MKTAITIGLAAALTLASAAMAGDDSDRPGRGARADANADGRVTLQETQAAMKARMMRLDTDKDGRVTQAEMEAARGQRMERRSERMRERGGDRFEAMDKDRNGQLSREEFTAGREQFAERRREHRGDRKGPMGRHRGEPGERFGRLDTNNDGAVSAAEMDQAAAAHFQQMDANKDGVITADERPERGRGRHR